MTWLLPDSGFLSGLDGEVRTVGEMPRNLRRRAYDRRYREQHREAIRIRQRALYLRRRAKQRAYELATKERDREKRRLQQRARYWRNPEKYRARAMAYWRSKLSSPSDISDLQEKPCTK